MGDEPEDTNLGVSFALNILPSGDVQRLRLEKDGVVMVFTKEQAITLRNEIDRRLGSE